MQRLQNMMAKLISSITDINDESLQFHQDDLTFPDTNIEMADRYRLQEGDIVFARTGASEGKSYIYKVSYGLVYYAGFLIRGKIIIRILYFKTP